MKITVEPEGEEKIETKVYNNVYEFGLIGTKTIQGFLPQCFSQAHGDIYILIGKLEELKERLRSRINAEINH